MLQVTPAGITEGLGKPQSLAAFSILSKASLLLSFQLNPDPPLLGDITQPVKYSKYGYKNAVNLVPSEISEALVILSFYRA